jgi:beta-RFAP synthase
MPGKHTITSVVVAAPARLHLGFLDLSGGLGRTYGSLGLAVDEPVTEVSVRRADDFEALGPESDRALELIRRCAGALGLDGRYRVEVVRAIPPHAGLGSGTQLTLAIGAALMRLENAGPDTRELGTLFGRGLRSAIGIAAFTRGGFIIDGGRGQLDQPPPVLVQTDFPEDWRALLILDPRAQGVHGDGETRAFAALPPFPEPLAGQLCRLVLLRLLPGIKEGDIGAFGAALAEIQGIVGRHFASAQGGSPWTSRAVGHMAGRLGAAGAVGVGQTSWGPTGFAFVPSQAAAAKLYDSLVRDARAEGLELKIVRGRNTGARTAVL